ncbi:hypothetical protein EniyanLRS_161 [Mycobacterium phage EniyanLRS]|uniref:Uncharacterized protein n=2 Tax=Mycobacterium virus Wildcat TaxID=1993859 RepID=A0A0B5A575_9CAUD|nr:hypothetical protein COSMO_169 [Mycobacterium phage Cosmo]AQT25810.1 hypothetical protein EniyanLRS_161 [Mycobacterium phage EniyanLRS]WKR36149.1 hypothetical protein [Mycobacterium phage Azrael100]
MLKSSDAKLDQHEDAKALHAMLSHIHTEARFLVDRVQAFKDHPSYDSRAAIKTRATEIEGAWRALYLVFMPTFEGEVWETRQKLDDMQLAVKELYAK